MNRNLAVLAFLSVALIGCSKRDHTVSYWKAHDQERLARLKECRDDTATGMTNDCRNAAAAQASIVMNGHQGSGNAGVDILQGTAAEPGTKPAYPQHHGGDNAGADILKGTVMEPGTKPSYPHN